MSGKEWNEKIREVTKGMGEMLNGGSTNSGVIAFKWITAAVGAILFLIFSFIMTQAVAKVGTQDQMIHGIKVQLAGMEKEMAHIEQLVRAVSELTLKVQGLDAKADRVDMMSRNSVDNVDGRLKIITERLLAVSQRLDGLTERERLKRQIYELYRLDKAVRFKYYQQVELMDVR